jgi:hypothetical protein
MYSTSAESLDHSRTAASDLGQEPSPSTTGPIKSTNRHYILQIRPINSVSGSGILPSPSYPSHDRRTGDDDVQCAFPRLKYNPNLVAMHSSISNKTLTISTGLTFGDNTCPSNWEPVARACQQLAQHLWYQEDIIDRARPYLLPMVSNPQQPQRSEPPLLSPLLTRKTKESSTPTVTALHPVITIMLMTTCTATFPNTWSMPPQLASSASTRSSGTLTDLFRTQSCGTSLQHPMDTSVE